MDKAKKQEIADKVIAHLRAQKKQAKDNRACVYRTEDGLKCAVGALIPDELYTPAIEGTLVSCINEVSGPHDGNYDAFRALLDKMGLDRKDNGLVRLLGHLQFLHDTNSNWTAEGIREDKVRWYMDRLELEYRPPTE